MEDDPGELTPPVTSNRSGVRPTGHGDSGQHELDPALEAARVLTELSLPASHRLQRQGVVGEGGMGVVEEVKDLALRRIHARKALAANLSGELDCQLMFIREARVMSQLDHPNIVPVHDMGLDDNGQIFFTMKLVTGKTLKDLIRERQPGPLGHEELMNYIDIVVRVCDALSFAHSRGVIHRDVKPTNVMVGEFGQVYLMDWGIARVLPDAPAVELGLPRSEEEESALVGTPSYMSPEQARGEIASIDQRTDVFLTGAMLYEILTGEAPYRGADAHSMLGRAAEAEFRPAIERCEWIPPALDRIVRKAMAATLAERYRSARELRDALVRFTRGGGDFPRVAFAAGEHVVRKGDAGDAAYLIVSGRCEVRLPEAGGESRLLRVLGPGDMFGETAILSPGPRTADVVAVEPTIAERVSRAVLEHELEQMQPWFAGLVRSLADRFRDSQ